MAASLSFSRRKPFSLFGVDTPLCGESMQFLTASPNAAFSSPDRQRRSRRCLSENDIYKKCFSPGPPNAAKRRWAAPERKKKEE